SVSQIEFWQKNAPNTLIFNEYGPTETVVGCVVYEGSKYEGASSVPIGRVIPNMNIYVLDDDLNQVPLGIQGELYIGGISLARGYLNKPDLTAEKFIPSPFTENEGDRIYKTGDLVRIQNDGNLVYLGRTDEQVKIRGYRIELDEIKKVLNKHNFVKDSAVIIKEIKDDVKLLLAFVISDENIQELDTVLFEHLNNFLPTYMIPNHFIQIEDIPLTVNGKLDKKKLLQINYDIDTDEKEFIEPRNDEEEILLKIWRSVLGIERISVNDNFFELGGDSILSIQIIAQANKVGLGLLPRHIFEHPTIDKLVQVIDKKHIISAEQGMITGDIKPIPIFKWFFEQNLTHPEHYNQSLMIGLKESINENELKTITREMILHHDILRLRILNNENNIEYRISEMNDKIPSYYYDYSSIDKEHLTEKIEEQVKYLQSSLDIYDGPMLKVAFFNLNESIDNILLVIFHHLVVDGVSWRIVMEDFNTALSQLKNGAKITLPPKSTSFAKWTKKLHEEFENGFFNEEYEYWQNILNGKKAQITPDFIKGENLEKSNRIVTAELSQELTDALVHDINIVYKTTILDILLAALVMSIKDESDDNDILFYLEGHGRSTIFDGIDLSRTVGWFTNIYPALININSELDLGDQIKSVKKQLRDIPNDGLGYSILKYLSQNNEIKDPSEVADHGGIIFNYLGQFNNSAVSISDNVHVDNKKYERSQDQKRSYLIDINGGINNGILIFEFNYSCNLFNKETIENFANLYIQSLEKIILHCQSEEIDTFSENDFEQFGWGEEDISDIINELDNIGSD
ncbi:MAG: condensation domain-containing protein, partial [Melioribacteraceae bacterium]|nr:condensation domain-containing protein [Melioribacteraceae bacterium]